MEEEGTLAKKEEEERKACLCFNYHPCLFLQQALRALLSCFGIGGIDSARTCSETEQDPLLLNSPTKSYQQQVPPDPPSTSNQTTIIITAASAVRRRGRGSGLSEGSGGQHN